jgi:hypothetical protein
MCILHGFILFFWIIAIFVGRKNALALQYVGGVILLLGLLEMIFMYLSLSTFNEDGQESGTIALWPLLQAILGVFKQTLSRLVVLLLMLGYTTARLTLSRPTTIFMLGTCIGYGISCLAYSLVKIEPGLKSLPPLTTEIIQFPGVMFNLVCFGWFFVAAYNTMQYLREHKEMWKVDKYHKLSIILAISLLLGILGTLGKGTALIIQWNDIWWQVWWMWDAFWHLLFLVSCVATIILWRPLQDNKVYGISEDMRTSQVTEQQQQSEDIDHTEPPTENLDRSQETDETIDSDREDTVRLLEMENLVDIERETDNESLI